MGEFLLDAAYENFDICHISLSVFLPETNLHANLQLFSDICKFLSVKSSTYEIFSSIHAHANGHGDPKPAYNAGQKKKKTRQTEKEGVSKQIGTPSFLYSSVCVVFGM